MAKLQRVGTGLVRVQPRKELAVRAVRHRAATLSLPSSRGFLGGLTGAIGGFLAGGPVGAIAGGLAGLTGRGDRPEEQPLGLPFAPTPPCLPGFERVNGRCQRTGVRGTIERALPGGRTGFQSDLGGHAVMGAFGLPATVPDIVGTITRRDGSTGQIRRCPARMVLGLDDLCYPKAILTRRSRYRKHRLPTRPPVTGADKAAINRAARVRENVKELAQDVGWKCVKK